MSAPSPIDSSKVTRHDVIIIGAGLSGLSAALRLAMFGKKVLLLEKHFVVGGLNSFYAKKGRKFDVGLHALTNFPSPSTAKSSPLVKICRQLRISIDSLELKEQSHSRISFGDSHLRFNNEFDYFISEIEKNFPLQFERFLTLMKKMLDFPAYSTKARELSTRRILKEHFQDDLLSEMLLCPTCYYGSARSNDIDFPTFVMLFDAIFRQGLARPAKGIRSILDQITHKLSKLGVERRMNTPVQSIETQQDRITCVKLAGGDELEADYIISTCGIVETQNLLNDENNHKHAETGRFTIIESIKVFAGSPKDFGWDETVVFFNQNSKFDYSTPSDYVDLRSGVICLPENYGLSETLQPRESKLRITHPANFNRWNELDTREYEVTKKNWEEKILTNGLKYLTNGIEQYDDLVCKTEFTDTFTPKTIKRFTSHENGALYGSPTKSRDGSTPYKNLFIAGTDQGYVGIVGAMLGGIAVANNHILS